MKLQVSKSAARRAVVAVALAAAVFGLVSCKDSPETRRKQAQSNGDKYWELLRANNPRGAYDQTFSESYKRSLDVETFLAFTERLSKSTGPILGYQVVHYEAQPDKPTVVLTYSVQTANVPDALLYDVALEQEGSEWRVSSIEPKIKRQPPAPSNTQAPLPGGNGSSSGNANAKR